MTELLPCPFCDHSDIARYNPVTGGKYFYIVCPKCEASGPRGTSEEGSIDGWNTRINIDPINNDQAIKDSLEQHNDKLRGEHED